MDFQKTNNERVNADETSSGNVRRKIWQINHSYHCSVIGICLSRADLRLLARKKIFKIPANSSDYEVHRELSGTTDMRSPKNRLLSKYLDARHAKAIKRYAHLQKEEEFRHRWRGDIDTGDVAGAYWAIMTHPQVTPEFVALVYGEGHILSFDFFSQARKESANADRLRDDNNRLQQQQQKLRRRLADASARNTQLEERLHRQDTKLTAVEKNLAVVIAGKEQLEVRLAAVSSLQELERVKLLAVQQEKDNIQLRTQLRSAQENVPAMKREKMQLLSKLEDLTRQMLEQRRETALLEQMALAPLAMANNGCSHCPEYVIDQSSGRGLCGKTVLYVGGRTSMIPHYKQLVEQRGGSFLHHDGGKENSRQLLPKLLCGADAVLCPIDCVSHDACLCVKKICKQYRKPFVMMRSSGLSSLAKYLESMQ